MLQQGLFNIYIYIHQYYNEVHYILWSFNIKLRNRIAAAAKYNM